MKSFTFEEAQQPAGGEGFSFDEALGKKKPGKGLAGQARDLGLSVAQGVVAVPEAAVGLADIATGGRVGKFLENEDGAIGFRPKQAKEYLGSLQTDQLKAQQQEFQQAEGILAKTGVALANPALIGNTIAQSAPGMLGGMGIARGAMALAPKLGAVGAGALGEGVVGAGAAAEQMRGETSDGLLTPLQSALAAATGVTTAGFGLMGGKIAQKLGIGDVDTMLASGARKVDIKAGPAIKPAVPPKGITRQAIEGAISEGFLEELPQSVSEQILSNLALDKPWEEGVEGAAVMGALAGFGMGGVASGVSAVGGPPKPPAPTPAPLLQLGLSPRGMGYDPNAGAVTVFPDGSQSFTSEVPPPVPPGTEPYRAPRPTAPAVAPSVAMGLNPNAGPISAAAATSVDTGASMPEAPPPPPAPTPPPVVLQNRDRTSAASIAQMQGIAANPDYMRVGPSSDMTSGAPVVFGDLPPTALMGQPATVVDGAGKRVQTQYAVVDAGDLTPSNNVDGTTVAEYATGAPGKLRSVAGNGRTAGLQGAYAGGTAGIYRQELIADAANFGADPAAVAGMARPVLVRVMNQADVTPDMGDRTNITNTQRLSPLEQAGNDARRLDVRTLEFDETGNPTQDSIKGFVSAQPVTERGDMMNADGTPTRQAVDRLMAATFKQAYDSDELVQLYAQATDPDARAVMVAAAEASGVMSNLKDTGEFDVRAAVADAAKMAVNAARQGVKLSDVLKNADMDMNPEAFPVAAFLAENVRSPRRMAEGLRRWGQLALEQARIAEENTVQGSLLGPTPTLSRQEIFARLGSDLNPTQQGVGPTKAENVAALQDKLRQTEPFPTAQGLPPISPAPRPPRPDPGTISPAPRPEPAPPPAETEAFPTAQALPPISPAPRPDPGAITPAPRPEPAPAPTEAPAPATTAAPAPAADIRTILNKKIPDMTADELRQGIAHYGPDHARTTKMKAALAKRDETTDSATPGETSEPQAPQAVEAEPSKPPAQPAAAAAASAAEPLTKGEAGVQWTRMGTSDRQALVARAGLAPIIVSRSWDDISGAHKKLTAAMNDTLAAKPATAASASGAASLREQNEQGIRDEGAAVARAGKERKAPDFLNGQSRDLWLQGFDSVKAKPSKPEGGRTVSTKLGKDGLTDDERAADRAPINNQKETERAIAAAAARVIYFTPGNVVRSYYGFDEVVQYNAPTEPGGAWSVLVHEVKEASPGNWVRQGKPQNARQHSTEPEDKYLESGPHAQLESLPAAQVPYSDPRPDGQPFSNGKPRGVAAPVVARRTQPGEPGYTLLDARNDLIDLREQEADQGQITDDRLGERIRQQQKLVRDMEAADKPASAPPVEDKPAAAPPKATPAPKPAVDPLDTIAKEAKAQMLDAAARLAQLLSKNTRMNITPEQEQAMLPIVIDLFDGAMKLGYVTFKKAARYVREFLANAIDQEAADAIPIDTLQGAYIATARRYGDKATTPKAEVVGINSIAELAEDEATPTEAPATPIRVTPAAEPATPATLLDSLYREIKNGNMPKDNPALKRLVEAFDGQPADPARMKVGQEQLEAAIVRAARDIVAEGKGVLKTYTELMKLYASQPNLNIRTSTSIANQAFSTPAPLAYIASQLGGVNGSTTLYEPTAGNGMLTIAAGPKNVTANELEAGRIGSLKALGLGKVLEGNALDVKLAPRSQDRVMTNPPFGSVKDDAGKPVKVQVDGYAIGQIDHLIAARALETMKDDGKAVLIIGANKVAGGLSTDDRIFFNWLYGHYNVTSHFEVAGDLYMRQGAGWPVRVITVEGRARTDTYSPLEGDIKRVDTWNDVYDQYRQILGSRGKPDAGAGESAGSAGNSEARPADVFDADGSNTAAPDRPVAGDGAGRAGDVAGTPAGDAPDRAGELPEGVGAGGDEQRLDGQPAEPDRLEPAGDGAKPAGAKPGQRAGADDLATVGNLFQIPYEARSGRKDTGILTPANMAQPTQDALSRLEDAVGNIDEYVRSELGYDSVDDMQLVLMGLQIDSVASAIYQIKQGKALIIADQTGIGKGRQAAAMIRWAVRQGRVPVFMSATPSLFTDIYSDLAEIKTTDIAPFIMNSDESIAGEDGGKLFANKATLHRAKLERIASSGELPAGSNALFATYSQINVANVQRRALMALAPNAIFILDEAHKAAGASATGLFMIDALEGASGVTYLSATFAKRPDNMPLYFKTDIGDAAADTEGLAVAMAAGGLPLQTVVSANLTKAGQMFRRERSYDGVSIESKFDTANRAAHEKLSDETTIALRAIVAADGMFHSIFVNQMQKAAKKAGASIRDNAGNQASASVLHTEFSSVVHNFVKQMLLGLKAQTAADEAIASLKRGEKPVIAVENTMGSFLGEYAEANGIGQGDSLGAFDYRTVLSRALERTLVVTEKSATGQETKRPIKLSELDSTTRAYYQRAQETIDGLKLDIPVSPLDWIRAELIRAGYSVAEITGRTLAVDYTDPKNPVLTAIDAAEKAGKVASTRAFNSGKLDAMILNVAGSTGISLHSSEKFEDQRQRHMIVAQAASDINTFMQMLGRIHRTGQMEKPKYTILSVDLPTEKRPTAVLSVKMKSLNANTSSNTESATSVKTLDILNKYGDQIIHQYLQDNYALARALGVEELIGGNDPAEDLAKKATGRLALQPIAVQHSFYDEVEGQYAALIDYLNKTNQNELEPRTFDFDAQETRQEVLFDGPNKDTPFGEDAIYGEYSIKAQGKAMTPTEIRGAMAENLDNKTPDEASRAMLADLDAKFKAYRATLDEPAWAAADQTRNTGYSFLSAHPVGSTFRVDINSDTYNAVVLNVRNTHKKTGNPFALSKMQVTVAVNGSLRSVTVPATQFGKIEVSNIGRGYTVEQLFKEQPPNQRETAKIVTGNLLAAYGELQSVRGTIITFTKADGTSEQGILLPKLFDYTKNTRGDYRLPTPAMALRYLQKSQHENIGRFGIVSRDGALRVLPAGSGVQIKVPKSKAKGAKYFLDPALLAVTGDFVTLGGFMQVTLRDPAKALAALEVLTKKQALYAVESMAEDAKALTGGDPPVFLRAAAAVTPGQQASDKRLADTESFVAAMAAGWEKMPQVVVARNMQDEMVPKQVRDYDAELKKQGGTGTPKAFLHKGIVYLLSDTLPTTKDRAEALFHEVLGHFGLRGAFGEALTPILQQMGTMRRADVIAKARQYGFAKGVDPKTGTDAEIWAGMDAKHRLLAAEEVLAELAQTAPTQGFVTRAIAAIRTWLRANVPGLQGMQWTDAEIVRSFIVPARDFVTRGERVAERDIGLTMEPAFSRSQGDYTGATMAEIEALNDVPTVEIMSEAVAAVGEREFERLAQARIDDMSRGGKFKVSRSMLIEATARNIVALSRRKAGGGQTLTAAFKEWFGESKVVDDDGKPLVVYHGTDADFSTFESSARKPDLGFHFGTVEQANSFAKRGGSVMPVYLRITNPLRLDDTFGRGRIPVYNLTRQLHSKKILTLQEKEAIDAKTPLSAAMNAVQAAIEAAGYDGVVYENVYEGTTPLKELPSDIQERPSLTYKGGVEIYSPRFGSLADLPTREKALDKARSRIKSGLVIEGKDSYIAFDSTQVKSATGNNGDFDPANPDISFLRATPGTTVRTGRILRSIDELVAAAENQGNWRDWYNRHEAALERLFANDAPLFQKILSATSQATGVKGNVTLALKAYDQLLSGLPFDGYLPAVAKNLGRIRDDQALVGAKIEQYGKANDGDTGAIAVDRHIAMLFFNKKTPNRIQIEAAKARIRKIADRLGWEPRQVQASLWAFNQVRRGIDPTQVQSYDTILEKRLDLINALRAKHDRREDGSLPAGGAAPAGNQAADATQEVEDAETVFLMSGASINAALNQRKTRMAGQTARVYDPDTLAAMQRTGLIVERPSLAERAKEIYKDAGKKLAQGIVDQFAPVRDMDKEAYGLLRLSKGAAGAFEAFLKGGKLKLTDKVYDFDDTQRGGVIDKLLTPLGGEHHDFTRWIAANRAERLMGENRENLFTKDDIIAFKKLADGTTGFDFTLQHGARAGQVTRNRADIYADSLITFNAFNKNILDMAEQSGLIDGESRKDWESEFYVPFYRVAENSEDGARGMQIKNGVVRQKAFERLKGGKDKLNMDLLNNTLQNWAHLLDASAKNRAAKATLEAAERMGAAIGAPEATARQMGKSMGIKAGPVWFMDGGVQRYFLVEDPYLMTALSSLEYAGMRNPAMNAMSAFKGALTIGVTASPFFKIRNLIRDSMQVVATSPISVNPLRNVAEGWKLSDPDSDAFYRLLAGGGTIKFGSMLENSEAKRVQGIIEAGVKDSTILNTDGKIKAFYRQYAAPAIDAYNALGDRGEAVNRASLYNQLITQGKSHAEASLMARDLMDFSMQGSFTSIRFLTQIVPFLNARLQGLYKLGRSAKEDPARFSATVGAVTLVSLALLAAHSDDEEWKERTESDRNNFWWFKVAGQAFRIPKPFEIGAIATLSERTAELMFDDEMHGKRFRTQVGALLADNLAMNPIPQMFKPALDVYSNKNSFTGAPIESSGQEDLQAQYRFNSRTSLPARAISTSANAVTGVFGKQTLSPVQVDHLIRGYFGWLGAFVVGAGDMVARPFSNEPERPTSDIFKTLTGNMVSDPRDAPSRYVSQMYEQATEIERAYKTWRSLIKEGKMEQAAEFRVDNQKLILQFRQAEGVKKTEARLNNMIRIVERSDASPDEKRDAIRRLQDRKNEAAKRLMPA